LPAAPIVADRRDPAGGRRARRCGVRLSPQSTVVDSYTLPGSCYFAATREPGKMAASNALKGGFR
jgi:hypothetical protein